MDGLQMLVLDLVLYTLIGIYIDNIFPREIGMQRSWHYVCDWLTPTYWDCFDICRRGSDKSQLEMRQEMADNAFKNRKSFRVALKNKDGAEI